MSLRPLSDAEEDFAIGNPMTTALMMFGALNGFLFHLRAHDLTLKARSYAPTPAAKLTLMPAVGGLAMVGYFAGINLYSDKTLRSIMVSHAKDRAMGTDVVKYTPRI